MSEETDLMLETHVVAVKMADGSMRLRVLGVPFGGPFGGKDEDGEYFDENTDLMLQEGDARPVVYYHGLTPGQKLQARPRAIGRAIYAAKTERGHYFDVILDQDLEEAKRVYSAAKDGRCYASVGGIAHLVRGTKAGQLTTYPVGELSLLDVGMDRRPSNPYAVAYAVKSPQEAFTAAGLPFPQAFAQAEAQANAGEETATENETATITQGETPMTPEEIQAVADAVLTSLEAKSEAERAETTKVVAIKAAAVEEYKASQQPAIKGGFAIKKVTKLGLSNDDMESFVYYLRTGDEIAVKAALNEATGDEGGFAVPNDFYTGTIAKRNQRSWLRKAGVRVFGTSRDILDIPTEGTETTDFVRIAENTTGDENEPKLGQAQVATHLWSKIVLMSESFAEDEAADVAGFIMDDLAAKMASTESRYVAVGTGTNQHKGVFNLDCDLAAYLDLASSTAIAVTEPIDLMYALTDAYRENSVFLMNGLTEGYLRKLQVTNFWAYPAMNGASSDPSGAFMSGLLGRPTFTNSNVAVMSATSGLVLACFDPAYYALVERTGLVVRRLTERYAEKHQIGIRAHFRQGGAPLQGAAFAIARMHQA